MEFRVEETITFQDYAEFSASYMLQTKVAGKMVRGSSALLTGMQGFGGVVCALLGAAFIIGGLIGGFFGVFGVIFLIAGLFLMQKARKAPSLRSRHVDMLLKRDTGKVPDTPMRFFFGEDQFEAFEANGNSSYRYFTLTDIWEDENRFYLFMEEGMKYILQKQGFVEGEPDDFSVWIAGKIGKDIKKVIE